MLLQVSDIGRALTEASSASDAWTVSGVLAVVCALQLAAIVWLMRRLMARYDRDEADARVVREALRREREEA